MENKNENGFVMGLVLFAAGAVVGSVAALLLAPGTGRETREKLKDMVAHGKEKVGEFLKKGDA